MNMKQVKLQNFMIVKYENKLKVIRLHDLSALYSACINFQTIRHHLHIFFRFFQICIKF